MSDEIKKNGVISETGNAPDLTSDDEIAEDENEDS